MVVLQILTDFKKINRNQKLKHNFSEESEVHFVHMIFKTTHQLHVKCNNHNHESFQTYYDKVGINS